MATAVGRSGEAQPGTGRAWLLLLALGILLFANQYVTLGRIKEFVLERNDGSSMSRIMDSTLGLVLSHWSEIFGWADLLIGASILAVLVALALGERSSGMLTALLQRIETSRKLRLALVAYLAVVAARSYLSPGQVFMGDTETHTMRSAMVAEHLRSLHLPVWSNYWYGGFPLLQFYAPLFFVLDGLLSLMVGDIHAATKLLLWSTHVGSVFTMYLYLERACRRPLPAVLGATAYGFVFHRLHMILYRGDLQLSILFFLYPLILLSAERALDPGGRSKRGFLALTLLTALMIVNHQGYAFFGLVFLGIYALTRIAASSDGYRERLRALTFFGASAASALALSAFLLVPFVLGMSDVRGMPNTPYGFLLPNPRAPLLLLPMFRWTPIGRVENVGYMGISVGVLALAGLAYGIRRRLSIPTALAVSLLASLFMSWNSQQYNIKNANFFMIFLAALAAWAPIAIEQWERPRSLASWKERWGAAFAPRLALILLALLLADLGPTTFHSVYREGYDFKERMYARLRALDDDAKVIEHQRLRYAPEEDPQKTFDPFKLGTPAAHSKVLTPLGFFHEASGRSFGYHIELTKNLHRDLLKGCLSELTVEGLYLMGVKFVLSRDRYRYFAPPLCPSSDYAFENDVLVLRHSTPMIFSTRVVTSREVEGFDRSNVIDAGRYFDRETYDYSSTLLRQAVAPIIEAMAIDRERGVAERLVAREQGLQGAAIAPAELEAEVCDFDVSLDQVTLRYRTSAAAVGQLSMSYFPYLDVSIDGRPASFQSSAMHTLLVALPEGEHVLTVRGRASPLRARAFWFSAAFLALLLLAPPSLFAKPG